MTIATNEVEYVNVSIPEAVSFKGREATIEYLSDELQAHPKDIHAILDDETEKVIYERGISVTARWPVSTQYRSLAVDKRRKQTYELPLAGSGETLTEERMAARPVHPKRTPRRPSVSSLMQDQWKGDEAEESHTEAVEAQVPAPAEAVDALDGIPALQPEPVEPPSDGLTDEEREYAHLVKLNDMARDVLAERDCPDGKRLQAIYNEHFNIDYLTGEVTWAKPTHNGVSKGQLAGTVVGGKGLKANTRWIKIKGVKLQRSKVLFISRFGVKPKKMINLDGDRRNDSLLNLEPVFE
ncbi:MAG: hypothetical protein ACFHXK_08045 [bacterium]